MSTGSFCSSIASFEFQCLPCHLCTEDDYAADGKCPRDKCAEHQSAAAAALAGGSGSGSGSGATPEEVKHYKALQAQDKQWQAAVDQQLATEQQQLDESAVTTRRMTEAAVILACMLVALVWAFCYFSWRRKAEIREKVQEAIQEYEKRMQRQGNLRYRPAGSTIELSGLTSSPDDDDDEEEVFDLDAAASGGGKKAVVLPVTQKAYRGTETTI